MMSGDSAVRAYGSRNGAADAAALEHGYLATLRRLAHMGVGRAVIRDVPQAPWDMAQCSEANIEHLSDCAFPLPRNGNREFDVRAARAVPGTVLIDLVPEVCPNALCRARDPGRQRAHLPRQTAPDGDLHQDSRAPDRRRTASRWDSLKVSRLRSRKWSSTMTEVADFGLDTARRGG